MQAKLKVMVPEKIHLLNMRILHGEMNSPFDFSTEEINHFDSKNIFDLAFNLDDKMVKADFKIEVSTISNADKNTSEASANFHFVYLFHVENLDKLADVLDDDTIDLKGGLGNALASITYSTTRGILMTRFQGTALYDFILPVINPNDLLGK